MKWRAKKEKAQPLSSPSNRAKTVMRGNVYEADEIRQLTIYLQPEKILVLSTRLLRSLVMNWQGRVAQLPVRTGTELLPSKQKVADWIERVSVAECIK